MSSTNEESPTTFSAKTREWLNSLNSKPTSSQVTRHEEKSQYPSLFSSGNDPYSNLDTEQKRMPDLLVDNSFTHSRKRVWIGGKNFLFNIIHIVNVLKNLSHPVHINGISMLLWGKLSERKSTWVVQKNCRHLQIHIMVCVCVWLQVRWHTRAKCGPWIENRVRRYFNCAWGSVCVRGFSKVPEKQPQAVQMYILTRAELPFTLCYEVPCNSK